MCDLCREYKDIHPDYIFCPMCGENLNNGFTPTYVPKVQSTFTKSVSGKRHFKHVEADKA